MIRKGKFDMALASVKVRSSGGDVRFLDTVPATVDGALWYEVENSVPLLCLHKGNYDYCYTHDKIRLADNTNDVLVVYLPFDVSTTNDACGNEWTVNGNPLIQNNAAVFDGSSYLQLDRVLQLGDKDFTVDAWLESTADQDWKTAFSVDKLTATNDVDRLCITQTQTYNTLYFTTKCTTDYTISSNFGTRQRYHVALVYSHSNATVNCFLNGQLKKTVPVTISRALVEFSIGVGFLDEGTPALFKGKIDHFRVHDGIALWTSNFTPPTAADYL